MNTAKDKYIGSRQTLVDAFEAQVRKTPDAPALCFENETLSYGILNQRINQLSNYLIPRISGKEQPVAICMERSLEMVISIYAIIKAGGAYVPLDPDHPSDRLAYVIKDANTEVVLTQSRFLAQLTKVNTNITCVDEKREEIQKSSSENPGLDITPENLAYIIYTSGSTGNPKGVMIEHLSIMNRLSWMQKELKLTHKDKVLQKTPYTFDVSVWEFFWPLQVGALLVIAKPYGHMNNTYLARTIQNQKITLLHFVPSMLKLFLKEKTASNCRSIRCIVCSGEVLRPNHKKRFYDVLGAKLYNMYGPTEAAVDVTSYYCDPDIEEDTIPIGKPIDNTDIHILDRNLAEVPEGGLGEIHIGGIQVARGYINQPGLTDEKFIFDPFRTNPEARLYKTGDLGTLRPDGNIEFHGRTDFQVKLRGIRVELSEIEQHITRENGVLDCVVIVWQNVSEEKHLIAYYCEQGKGSVNTEQIKAHLKTRLPDFMIPEHYILIPEMPRLSSGKVNRKALPAPVFKRVVGTKYIAPLSDNESRVSAIWNKLLKLDKVGIDDSFFDVGGNSFLLIRVLSELNNQYVEEIPLIALFSYPTIRKLSLHLGATNEANPSG